MTESRQDVRQHRSRDLLDQVTTAVDKDLDVLLRSINKELTPPLRLSISGTHVVNVSDLSIQNPETNKNRIIPPINNLLPFSWAGGNVTVPASNNANITNDTGGPAVLLNIPASNYVRMGISLNSLGQTQITLGLPNAVLNDATAPATPNNTFGVGHVVLFNNAGAIEDLASDDIFQYVGGGGGSGSGNANTIETAIRDQLLLSPYNGATPVIFEIDEDDFEDPTSTGTYSIVSGTYDVASTEKFVSKQMLDANEFLNKEKDISEADLTIFWNTNGTPPVGDVFYRISRDGGGNWEDLTVERVGDGTSAWYGTHQFADPVVLTEIFDQPAVGLQEEINATSSSALGMKFTNPSAYVATRVTLEISKIGSPLGNLCVFIAKDSSGLPGEIIGQSDLVDVTALAAGPATVDIDVSNSVLIGGDDYHVIIKTDADYKSSFVAATDSVTFTKNASADGMSRQDAAGLWTDAGSEGLTATISGRILDLRIEATNYEGTSTSGTITEGDSDQMEFTRASVKPTTVEILASGAGLDITWDGTDLVINVGASGTALSTIKDEVETLTDGEILVAILTPVDGTWTTTQAQTAFTTTPGSSSYQIDGFGVFYDKKVGTLINGIKNFDRRDFKAVADNDNEFTLNFIPDPDLLDVYHVQEGNVWKRPAFDIQGNTIVFPANFFNNGGIETDVTLLFLQTKGATIDNSDANAALMAENFLGSENTAYDKSEAGKGIKIRALDGTLCMIGLDENKNIIIYEIT